VRHAVWNSGADPLRGVGHRDLAGRPWARRPSRSRTVRRSFPHL